MKQLSVEEKAKAYDEAIERGKQIQNTPYTAHWDIMKEVTEHLLPELREESEDERIKWEIIEHINNMKSLTTNNLRNQQFNSWLTWLEKQGEQKSFARYKVGDTIYYDSFGRLVSFTIANIVEDGTDNPMYEDKDGNSVFQNDIVKKKSTDKVEPKFNVGDTMRTLQEAKDGWTDGMPVIVSIDEEYYHCTNELIAIKDQDDYEFPPINVKHTYADNVEPKFHEGDIIIHKELGGDYIHNPHKIIQVDIFDKKYRLEGGLVAHFGEQDDYELVEQNPAWSEEDNIILNEILSFIPYHLTAESYKKFTNWLKSFKNRVQPQLQIQQEWNEKDLTMIESIIQELEPSKYRNTNELKINWLESLKNRVQPQPKQEWSKEDDYNLQCCVAKIQYDIDNGRIGRNRELLTWLKDIKDRIQPQPQQKWSEEDEAV